MYLKKNYFPIFHVATRKIRWPLELFVADFHCVTILLKAVQLFVQFNTLIYTIFYTQII